MKRIHLSNSYSIDYIIKILMIILLPIVLLDSIISIYVIHSMRQQTVNALQDTTTLYISQIDTEHTSINKYLMRRLTENTDVQTILETDDSLKLISSFEKARRDVDTFMESFENGAVRIGYSKYTEQIDVTAYEKPDGKIVVELLNKSKDIFPVNVRIQGQVAEILLYPESITTGLIE